VLLKNYHWDLSGSISVSKPILGPRTFILSLMTTARETKNHRSWTKAKDNIPDLCEHAIKTKKTNGNRIFNNLANVVLSLSIKAALIAMYQR